MSSALFAMMVNGIPLEYSFVLVVADTKMFDSTHDVNYREQL